MTSFQYKFSLGDLVTRAHGKKEAEITDLPSRNPADYGWSSQYACRYLHGARSSFRAYENELKLSETSNETAMETKTLYSFTKSDGTQGYGTYLATNSANQVVIEEKGTGTILTFDKDQLEEVLPYTFCVKVNGRETHYMGEKDSVKKGDMLILTDVNSQYAIGTVTAVDTKNKSARAKFKGRRLVTEAI